MSVAWHGALTKALTRGFRFVSSGVAMTLIGLLAVSADAGALTVAATPSVTSDATRAAGALPSSPALSGIAAQVFAQSTSGAEALPAGVSANYTFTTFAGSAATGTTNGTGTAARFTKPDGVAVDPVSGNVYVADTNNHTIRKITPAGVVTLFAGTPGVSGSAPGVAGVSRLNGPIGIAVDTATGDLYVADTENYAIKRITAAGVASLFAGSPGQFGNFDGTGTAARFGNPTGITADGLGNLFVTDAAAQTIRKIVISTAAVTTFAGTAGSSGTANGTGAAARFNDPQGIAYDSISSALYVAERQTATIRKITSPGAVVTTFAGTANSQGFVNATGAAARFNRPRGISTDGSNLYVADDGNSAIRKITMPGAVVTTLAGGVNFGIVDGTGGGATFIDPTGIAVNSAAGVAYVVDEQASNVRKVTTGGGVVTTFAGEGDSYGTANGTGSAARFFFPPMGVLDPVTGDLYVTDYGSSTIRKVTAAGVVTTFAGTPLVYGSANGTGPAAQFQFPVGIARDTAGNLYVADAGNSTIRKITPGAVVTTLAGTAGLSGNADGTGAAARFNDMGGVAVDVAGNVYVADSGNATIRKITPGGVVTTLAGLAGSRGTADGTGSAARFQSLNGLAIDSAGTLYVGDQNRIRKVTSAGVVTTLAGNSANFGNVDGTGTNALFEDVVGVALDAAGNVFVTDDNTNTVRRVTQGGIVSTIAGRPYTNGSTDGSGSVATFSEPSGIVVSGRTIYIMDSGNSTIRKGVFTGQAASGDLDADGRADFSVFRPSTGTWFTQKSTTGFTFGTSTQFGTVGDVPVPGDYDGDGFVDLAVYRPSNGTWYVLQSSTSTMVSYVWGAMTDIPVPGDYDGDKRTDPAVYRPSTNSWLILQSSTNYTTTLSLQWGARGDIPAAVDVDGDGRADLGIFRPSTATWYALLSSSGYTTPGSLQFGKVGDIPVPGDYDGNGTIEAAVFRPSTGTWFLSSVAGSFQFGAAGDIPVPADYDGDNKTDIAVYRPSTGTWFVLRSNSNFTTTFSTNFGAAGDIPVVNPVAYAVTVIRRVTEAVTRTADVDGDAIADVTVFRAGTWLTVTSGSRGAVSTSTEWGTSGDIPVAGDYDGDARTDVAVYRPSSGTWFAVLSNTGTQISLQWGAPGDIPVPGDYDGDGLTDVAVFRPSSGTWFIRTSSSGFVFVMVQQFGANGDVPVMGDYDGDGITDMAVFRPSIGTWFIRRSSTALTASYQWGTNGDVAVPGDYDGDGLTDLAVFRAGVWYIELSTTGYTTSTAAAFGTSGDIPVPDDYDGDGKTDLAVFRPSIGTWFVWQSSTGVQTSFAWGTATDVPVVR